MTQLAVAWILSVVFVRTLEDRGYVDPRVAGATAEALRAAEDREALFLQVAPFLGPREYLLAVFRELAKLPGARDVFDTKHNPVWVLSPSSEGAQALLDFFRKRDASGAPALVFAGEDTRFLGDLYQDLSEAVRKRYALLQTPEFVEEFILDQTLEPAIAEFGLRDVSLIDPTCGSGHFLLGAFRRLLGRWQKEASTENIADLARRALDHVYGVDINPYAVAMARASASCSRCSTQWASSVSSARRISSRTWLWRTACCTDSARSRTRRCGSPNRSRTTTSRWGDPCSSGSRTKRGCRARACFEALPRRWSATRHTSPRKTPRSGRSTGRCMRAQRGEVRPRCAVHRALLRSRRRGGLRRDD